MQVPSALLLAAWSLAATVAGAGAAAPQASPARAPQAQPPAQAPAPPPRYRLAGRIELTQDGRPATDRALDPSRAAVWFVPDAGGERPRPLQAAMTTVRKQFEPAVLVVPVGSTVRFPNQDPILHNVFSVSGRNSFDLGLVGAGQGKTATFREAGLVRVFCNVHHGMFAHVMVVESAHYAAPDGAGRFVLTGLPGGRGRLRFWHERGEVGETPVEVPRAGELVVRAEITRPKVPPHRNKFGKSYTRGTYE